mgnify:CR=1 FL=1
MVNAYQIKKFGDMDLRKAKTDKKDAVRIARYALEKSYSLVPYTSMEQKYEDLRFLARQYNQRMLTLKTNKVFLLNLLDETMPGITNILPLTTRTPETSLSVLFINRFKSYDRIEKMGKSRFLDAFEKNRKEISESPNQNLWVGNLRSCIAQYHNKRRKRIYPWGSRSVP